MCRSNLQRKTSVISLSMYHTIPFSFRNKPVNWLKKSVPCNSAHGHLKSVRLPKKFDDRNGFAFLEFISRHEAESAYNTLRHIHLPGRRLVLEWTEEAEQDLSVLRQKIGVKFGGGKEIPGKKRKLDLERKGDKDPIALDEESRIDWFSPYMSSLAR